MPKQHLSSSSSLTVNLWLVCFKSMNFQLKKKLFFCHPPIIKEKFWVDIDTQRLTRAACMLHAGDHFICPGGRQQTPKDLLHLPQLGSRLSLSRISRVKFHTTFELKTTKRMKWTKSNFYGIFSFLLFV